MPSFTVGSVALYESIAKHTDCTSVEVPKVTEMRGLYTVPFTDAKVSEGALLLFSLGQYSYTKPAVSGYTPMLNVVGIATLPAVSCALQVTVVVPTGKSEPDTGVQVTGT